MGRKKKQTKTNSTFVYNATGPNPSADLGFHFLPNAATITSVSNVASHKRVRLDDIAEDVEDDPSFLPIPPLEAAELAAVADTLNSNDVYEHQIEEEEVTKRHRYESSDDPMKVWRRERHIFLDNLLRQDGLGEDSYNPACSFCDATYELSGQTRIFRCQDCGIRLQCLACLQENHGHSPLHVVKEWTGEFWNPVALHRLHLKDESSRSLRFGYQLGHKGGSCPLPRPPQALVVIDTNVAPASQRSNAHDFVGTLERLTDPTGLGKTPDRYRAFSRMARQHAWLKRGKRSGLGHRREAWNADAVGGAYPVPPGALAVLCWACPQPGFNLPEGWENCDPEDEFLYGLMLALDANFRLKNRMRANERHDPSLGSGWSYFMDDEPYKEHLRDYVAEEDVSTCIAFAALMQKETRLTTGLRVSGVGGRGERYVNMDYVLMHALRRDSVKRLVLSYDIACQWKQHLRERVVKILDHSGIPPNLDDFDIQYALPVWHAAAHEESCQATNSLSYAVGVGRTDGEGIERTWAVLNPIGFATKEMGQGNRHDTIDDKVDHINFEKNVGLEKQVAEFVEVDSSLAPEVRREWKKRIQEWLADKGKPNPYLMAGGKDAGPSEAQVAAALKQAEVQEARNGRGEFLGAGTTVAAFIKGLLQLEDLKHRIKNEVRGSTTLTANRLGQIEELRASFFKKLKVIQRQQDVFMPGVAALRLKEEELRDVDRLPPNAEDTKLWLPSDLKDTERGRASRAGLATVEAKLREAQCGDALTRIHSLLYAKTHLIHHRNANSVGQRASTRSSTIIGRVTDQITREATKYRQARIAFRRLMGAEDRPDLEELTDGDLNVREEGESDAGGEIEIGGAVSWIWKGTRPDDGEVGLHDAVRVRWAKTLARRDRWNEEVRLLHEEMKRVLRSLRSVQQEWEGRIEGGREVDPELAGGLRAYAKRQAAVHRWMAERVVAEWTKPGKVAVEAVMQKDAEIYRELLAGEGVATTVEDGSIAELEMDR
ncbi:hypothetical protein C8F01DRAFT_1250435 [Mycena amicta]|nr:hypothetical protein C8F01DRAFT_1250435 [Mycena amicta]